MGIFSFINKNIILYYHKKRWRKLNKHNETVAMRMFDRDKVSVGNYTYGHLNVFEWGMIEERLQIGNFVSIAEGVKFILGGNHSTDSYSTFPFSAKAGLEAGIDAKSKGAIVVNDDVWIGLDVVILSGVTIGRGAVIAAGSIVTRDVQPYAIVAGNPAKFVKYRLSQDEIKVASKIDFNKIKVELIDENNVHILYSRPKEVELIKINRLYVDE